MPIELKIFGAVSAASSGSGSPVRLTQPRPLALLTYLVLARPRGPQSRDTLTALLWPDADQASARQGLRNALHRIRTTLGEGLIVTSGETLVSVDRSQIECDALFFENAVESERWGDAVSLFSGEPLQGFHVENASELDGWLDSERARLREAAARAAWAHASALRARGDGAGAIGAARHAHSLSQDDERSLRRLLDLLAAAGDSAGAIKTYDDFAKRMATEFDAEPSAETRAVIQAIRAGIAERTVAFPSISGSPPLGAIGEGSRADDAGQRADESAVQTGRAPRPAHRPVLTGAVSLAALALTLWIVASPSIARETSAVDSPAADPASADLPARWRADEAHLLQYIRAHATMEDGEIPAARRSFERLVKEAPFFAPGWAGLSVALYRSGFNDIPPDEAMARALEAARRALALDSTLAEPHETFIAYDMWGRWDLPAAKERLDSAIARHPDHLEFYNLLGTWHRFRGDFTSSLSVKVENSARDPLAPRYAYQRAVGLYFARHCEESASEYRRLPPELRNARGNVILYRALACQGKEDEAVAVLRDDLVRSGDTALARRLESSSTPERADAVEAVFRKRLAKQLAGRLNGWTPPDKIMLQYAEMHNADSTLIWLDSMYVDRSMMLYVVPFDPLHDFLVDDPRFKAFVDRLPWLQQGTGR